MLNLSGEFRHNDGVTPNNITLDGTSLLLSMALRGQAQNLFVGLCNANFAQSMSVADIEEPTIGVGGYERVALSASPLNWPNLALLGDSIYVESKLLVWTPEGAGFDKDITRMFICGTVNSQVGSLFCLSAALPAPRKVVTPFSTTYRIYAR